MKYQSGGVQLGCVGSSKLRATSVPARDYIPQPELSRYLRGERPHKKQRIAKTILIDNYDSYTYNLYQLISRVTGETPTVIQNDELTWRALNKRLAQREFQSIVISPGPGTPHQPSDLGVCSMLLEEAEDVPILGVCLGMQALAHVHGGQVVRAVEPIHGRLSQVCHTGNPLFTGIPSGCALGFEVVRYHSLAVKPETLPSVLEPIAWTCGRHHAVSLKTEGRSNKDPSEDEAQCSSVLMGIAHRSRPHWGVQFHPESVATSYGDELMRNFFWCSEEHHEAKDLLLPSPVLTHSNGSAGSPGHLEELKALDLPPVHDNLDVRWHKFEAALDDLGGPEAIFWHLHGHDDASDTFWLDSASMEGQRFSYMGGRGGPLWQRLTFHLAAPETPGSALQPGKLCTCNAAGEQQTFQTHFLDFLEAQLQQNLSMNTREQLPFEFTGGYVGYLGYEMKAECGAPAIHASSLPDAAMFFIDRLITVDHATKDVYLVALHTVDSSATSDAQSWLDRTIKSLQTLAAEVQADGNKAILAKAKEQDPRPLDMSPVSVQDGNWQAIDSSAGNLESRKTRQEYIGDVETCLEALRSGESYELCLTTQLKKRAAVKPQAFYSLLRASNPAAHSAWLSFSDDLPKICCSSPERFLKGSADGVVEARPIKGTARRYVSPELDQESKATLMSSAKARAENLMIVDLLRNDLGRVCEVGTVHVPGLMEVESYSTVHNLVSTVRGNRKEGSSAVDCLRACFPGGSMTGAPKRRSMEILERLEGGPRGVYSGCLGFIGLNNTFDLNIVIRTAVISSNEVTIGAGGAIVLQSDPEEEYEEMMLKASALMNAVDKSALT